MTVSERIGTLGAMGDILSFIDPKDNYPTTSICSAPGSLDTSLSHAAGLIEIAACHA